MQLSVLFGNNSFGNSWHLSITCYRCYRCYICYMAGRISTDMNGYERMKKRSVKKFWKELPEDEALWPEKASEAKLQFVRKLLSMFFFKSDL